MSIIGDFLKEKGISAADVAARSKGLETFNDAERAMKTARREARRLKKSYADAKTDKPPKLGRGISERAVSQAVAGTKLSRVNRKKIVRAINSILTSKKQSPVEWRAVFSDVGAKKGKSSKPAG